MRPEAVDDDVAVAAGSDGDVEDRIRTIISTSADSTRGRPVRDFETLENLGLDSAAVVDIVMAIEQEFKIEFPDEMLSAETFESVGSISRAVGSLSHGDASQSAT